MKKLLSKREVAEIIQMHPESIMRLSRTGKFPRYIKIGRGNGGAVRFLDSDVEEWIANKRLPVAKAGPA
jgi:predicted DNA-binding transcriptional regulator AlpA